MKKLVIKTDENSESPREWDNLGIMYCWHSRYTLGDKNPYATVEDFRQDINDKTHVILPLYLYDHSGLRISTTGFSCRWDSMQVGYIAISFKKIKEEYSVNKISKSLKDKVIRLLEGEVEIYDLYLRGEVYGFEIIEEEICEHCQHVTEKVIDSCYGFYGEDWKENGLIDYIPEDMQEQLKDIEVAV